MYYTKKGRSAILLEDLTFKGGNMAEKKAAGWISLMFVGCLVLGLAIGLLLNQPGVGVLIGLGVGFILMGILRLTTKDTQD